MADSSNSTRARLANIKAAGSTSSPSFSTLDTMALITSILGPTVSIDSVAMDIEELCRIRWLVSSASELGRRNKRRGSSMATAVGMEAKDAMMMRMDLDNVFIVDIYWY